MSIVVAQLIASPTLQDALVNKQGTALAAGVVTCYEPDMVTLKNWYYQTGTPGSYTYIALPNPMTLSAAGTIVDVNGQDTIPFFYPYSETDSNIAQPYFITVYDSFGQFQFSRSNFPFVSNPSTATTIASLENYVINNRFWRNIGTLDASTLANSWTYQYNNSGAFYYYATLCPDQHDGFSMPDFNYIKNVNGSSSETITFNKFAETNTPILTGDVTPEYYINHTCTADASGSTLKVYQFPVSLHLATLVAQQFSFTIQGQSISGTATVGIYLYQFCGSGVASPSPKFLGNLTFGANWTRFTITGQTFSGTTGLTLGNGQDDAYYIQIAMPTGASVGVCNLNFTLPSIYLSTLPSDIPTNTFSTYDQIDSVIGTPRTGDLRNSINNFYYYGWLPMNDGTIGNASSNSTCRANADTWPLYNLIWNAFQLYSTGTPTSGANPIAQMYSSTGTLVGYGSSISPPTTAISDFNANKALSLTKSMTQVMMGSVPLPTLLPSSSLSPAFTATFTASGYTGVTPGGSTTNAMSLTNSDGFEFFLGTPVVVSNTGGALPTGLTAGTVYYAAPISQTVTLLATSFQNALTINQATSSPTLVAYMADAGTGTNTVSTGMVGTMTGEYSHVQLLSEVTAHTHTAGAGTGSGSNAYAGGATLSTGGVTRTNPGTTIAANIMQPGTYINVYIKQ